MKMKIKQVMMVTGLLCAALGQGVLAQGQDQGGQVAPAAQPAQAAQAAAPAQPAAGDQASKPRPAVQVTVGGQKASVTEGPVWFEWAGSESLTRMGLAAARDRNVQAAASRQEAVVRVTVSGELVLIGGPKFHRGTRAPLAEVVERAAKLDGSRSFDASDAKRIAADGAIAAGVVKAGLGTAVSGLALADVFIAISDATGVKGWFNTKLVGDPRGICISNCATWNHVKQTAYIVVRVEREDRTSQEVRIMSQATGDELVVNDVVQGGLEAVWALFSQPAAKAAASGGTVAVLN
jgi:hypothetical protein